MCEQFTSNVYSSVQKGVVVTPFNKLILTKAKRLKDVFLNALQLPLYRILFKKYTLRLLHSKGKCCLDDQKKTFFFVVGSDESASLSTRANKGENLCP